MKSLHGRFQVEETLSSMAGCMGPDRTWSGQQWLCPPPPVMGGLPLAPLCLLPRAPSLLSTHSHLLPVVICFALFLLCLFKECRWRGCHGMKQHPEVTELCVIQRAQVQEGRYHSLPWTSHEVVAVKGPSPDKVTIKWGGRKGLEQF